MNYQIIPIFTGFPAQSSRGFLGWSSVYLVKVKMDKTEKLMLFDTGGYNERFELIKKLKEYNVNVEDVDTVFISHLHFDHAVNWNLFPNADIYINREELVNARNSDDMMIPDFHAEKLEIHENIKFVEAGDVIHGFKVISLPGHTLNLMGLKIDTTFLVSDAIKNRNEILNEKLGNTIDIDLARETVKYLVANAEIIYPGHDDRLVKKGNTWESDNNNEITIIYSNNLIDSVGRNKIKLNIKNQLDGGI